MPPENGSDAARTTVAADGLVVDRERRGSALVYRATGEVDTLTAPHLDRALAADDGAPGVSRVVLDLSDVPFLSSAGLSILVEHHTRCQREGMAFAVVATRHAVLRAIQITALDRIIPLFDTIADALAAHG